MNTVDLSRIALPINIACCAAGILTYSTVAPMSATHKTAIISLGAFICSILLSIYTTRFLRRQTANLMDQGDSPPLTIKFLIGLPPIFCAFEVVAILMLNAPPSSVSWLHILAAVAAGQNAEGSFKRK